MFGLGKNETAPAAPAGPATIDLALSFEPGYAVLEGGGLRFRIAQADAETLVGRKTATARRFEEQASPARGVFDQGKTAKIAHYLSHGLDLSQIAQIFGEPSTVTREYYGWAISQGAWNDGPARDERLKLAEGDRVRSTAGIVGGTINNGGVLVSCLTGVPVQQKFARLNGIEVAQALRVSGGNVKDSARELMVDADDLTGWLERNAEMMAVLK